MIAATIFLLVFYSVIVSVTNGILPVLMCGHLFREAKNKGSTYSQSLYSRLDLVTWKSRCAAGSN